MKKQIKIIIAEDDNALRETLQELFEDNNYVVHSTDNGSDALRLYHMEGADLVLLDVDMPEKNGREVASIIRNENSMIPIIIMTGQKVSVTETGALASYDAGATSFIRKPFYPKELLANVQALLKQSSILPESYSTGNIRFDIPSRTLHIDNQSYLLKEREALLLGLLLKYANQILETKFLLEAIWKSHHLNNYQMLRNTIAELKKKLKDNPFVELKTIHGKGYVLVHLIQ